VKNIIHRRICQTVGLFLQIINVNGLKLITKMFKPSYYYSNIISDSSETHYHELIIHSTQKDITYTFLFLKVIHNLNQLTQ